MTEKELWGYFGKKVKVKCTTGEVIKGIVKGFTRAIDNDPEVASNRNSFILITALMKLWQMKLKV